MLEVQDAPAARPWRLGDVYVYTCGPCDLHSRRSSDPGARAFSRQRTLLAVVVSVSGESALLLDEEGDLIGASHQRTRPRFVVGGKAWLARRGPRPRKAMVKFAEEVREAVSRLRHDWHRPAQDQQGGSPW